MRSIAICDADARLKDVVKVWRENRCISQSTAAGYSYWVRNFIAYCDGQQARWDVQLTHVGVLRFVRWYARSRGINAQYARNYAHTALHAWREGLCTLGRSLPPWRPQPDPLLSLTPVLREFAVYMRDSRGSPRRTIEWSTDIAAKFCAYLHRRRRHIKSMRLTDFDAYLVKCSECFAPATVAGICSALRSFARFLTANGQISVDLAPSLLRPAVRNGTRPLRALPWDDVRRILRAIDQSTGCGKRDYALLLLMSTYGLGAGETLGLKFDDIDWCAATLRIVRPKTRVKFVLPLLPAVAQSMASYLRYARPVHTPTRYLFVQMCVPHRPLRWAATIRYLLVKYARAAGVSASYLGSHVLRHTQACRQMELGIRPKLIADILGHQDPQSTSAYLRITTERLRQMALPVPR